MTFNIIYTPGSVKFLIFFVESILEFSPYKFRLISNGCFPQERRYLRDLCEKDKRLSYLCYPTFHMEAHGKVLDYLQAVCDEPFFCFMDSDIFLTKPLPDLERLVEELQASSIFSGMPVWCKAEGYAAHAKFQGYSGTINKMDNGLCLGSTYFAVYTNEHLNQTMQKYSLSFKEVYFKHLSSELRNQLDFIENEKASFDSGKIVNIFMQKEAYRLKNVSIDGLNHIGGTSFQVTYNRSQRIKEVLKNAMSFYPLKTIVHVLKKLKMYFKYYNISKEELEIMISDKVRNRDVVRKHFIRLFLALSNHSRIPELPELADDEIQAKLNNTHKGYISTFMNYYNNSK